MHEMSRVWRRGGGSDEKCVGLVELLCVLVSVILATVVEKAT